MASNEASSKPTGPFDFAAMSGLVNDPSIEELADQIAKDPTIFNHFSTMTKVMENPDFKTLAMRLANAMIQDPSVSSMLHNYTNPPNKQERMARINEDPSLKHILDEISAGGPAAMMRYWNDEEVLNKLGLAMGINPNTGGEAAASSDNFSEDCKKLLFGFILKLNLVDYAQSRPFGPKSRPLGPLRLAFYWIGYGRSNSGTNLCVQETKPVNWRNALLPLLVELEEEEKVKVAKLEENVNVTELERLKVKVPRFTKEFILVLFLQNILDDMRRYNCHNLKMHRRLMSDEANNRGGELVSVAAMLAKEQELLAEGIEMYRAKLRLKGIGE